MWKLTILAVEPQLPAHCVLLASGLTHSRLIAEMEAFPFVHVPAQGWGRSQTGSARTPGLWSARDPRYLRQTEGQRRHLQFRNVWKVTRQGRAAFSPTGISGGRPANQNTSFKKTGRIGRGWPSRAGSRTPFSPELPALFLVPGLHPRHHPGPRGGDSSNNLPA